MTRSAVGHLIRAPKTADLIAANLRAQIVRGQLPAGDTLPSETELMGQFGVSRPTLREAFRILETESLIRIRRGSHGGAQVTAPELAVAARYVGLLLQVRGTTIGDVYEARMTLEPACARLVAQRRTDVGVAELQAVLDELKSAVSLGKKTLNQWSLLTFQFHDCLVRLSGNNTLMVQCGVLHDIAMTHISTSVQQMYDDRVTPANFKRLIRSYQKLIDLVSAGDTSAAEVHWRKHMDAAGKLLLAGDHSKVVVDLFY